MHCTNEALPIKMHESVLPITSPAAQRYTSPSNWSTSGSTLPASSLTFLGKSWTWISIPRASRCTHAAQLHA